jgi:molecular chaperone DnaK
MANWRLGLKRIFRALCRPFLRLLRWRSRSSQQRLAQLCESLNRCSSTDQTQAWTTYLEALSVAQQVSWTELIELITQFDSRLQQHSVNSCSEIEQAVSFLLARSPQTSQTLEAAWKLSTRFADPITQDTQQQICLQLAQLGDSDVLLSKLLKRRTKGTLDLEALTQVLRRFLLNHSFQPAAPWRAFFAQDSFSELPPIHQVYALLGRSEEASDLAESAHDYRSAIQYLVPLTGEKVALRRLTLAEQLGDKTEIARSQQALAETYWQAQNYQDALKYFQSSGSLDRASDCYQRLGELDQAIHLRPLITSEWMQEIQTTLFTSTRQQIERKDFLTAVQALQKVKQAWQEKIEVIRDQTEVTRLCQSETIRIQQLLTEAVRTARSALTNQMQAEGDQPSDFFKRWSQLEEAAGNYLEAGLQAERAEDFFTASVLFEKAGAFGQALVTLESASPDAIAPRKKAQLLEQGGDFFMAGLLYERLGEVDAAIALYEQANEFLRAAQLRQQQLGDEQAVFDQQYQSLITKAGQVEQLAEQCQAKATEQGRSSDEKARLWRRIKDLAEQGVLGQKWLDRVAAELPDLEALDRQNFDLQVKGWITSATQQVLATYIDGIGLDLGTSNSVVCLYNKSQQIAEVVELRGRRQIPSVFAIDQAGRERVGIPISELLTKSPRAIITKVKREMGTDRRFRVAGQEYRAEEISARFIHCAREAARASLRQKISARVSAIATQILGKVPPGDWISQSLEQFLPTLPLSNLVVTVPAYFNEAQKQATKTAGVLAEMTVLRLIHEPTAACLAQQNRKAKDATVLVADLGAGTFDLSIIQTDDSIFEVQEIEGDNALGSADLDEILYCHFAAFVQSETGQEPPRNSQAATRLRQACEELKIELSSQRTWTIDLPYLMGDRTIQLTLTRTELERLAAPWLDRIRTTCQKVRHKPNFVLLIGGGGLMPIVRQTIREVFRVEPSSDLDPLTAVARGAALQAAILTGDLKDTLLLDIVPFSLGIKCQAAPNQFKFDVVIAKHTRIPTCKTQRYTTTVDDQTMIKIEVFQGESLVPEQNFKIGEFLLQGIPRALAGVPQVDVEFSIDANCLLTVSARDIATGNQHSIAIADSHLLTPAQTDLFKSRFRSAQAHQAALSTLEKLAADLVVIRQDAEKIDLFGLTKRFQERIHFYERNNERYTPTLADNTTLFEIYRDRTTLEDEARLLFDRWGTLSQSVQSWLERYQSFNWQAADLESQIQQLLEDGSRLLKRTQTTDLEQSAIASTYQRWLSVLETLPANLNGEPEDLAHYFLGCQRYDLALAEFERIPAPLSIAQVELGLEIFARSRQRVAYTKLLLEQAASLQLHTPDFKSLNSTVHIYQSSVVLIQVNLGGLITSGSGFAISSTQIATNRHVLFNETTGSCVHPDLIQIMTHRGSLQVTSIHLPTWGTDDIVILEVQPELNPLTPLRLGFSELVEIGEPVMTLGFPAPESQSFEQNLYCNTGLVNRIRQSQFCTERVLEVSIPLQGGISGAPILNQLGEVVGLLTFYTQGQGGGRSFYAIPVEVLCRLRTEVQRQESI